MERRDFIKTIGISCLGACCNPLKVLAAGSARQDRLTAVRASDSLLGDRHVPASPPPRSLYPLLVWCSVLCYSGQNRRVSSRRLLRGGRASSIFRLRPSNSVPLSASLAFSASSTEDISTKPKPRPSITFTFLTVPKGEKSS